jgi:hypothetical protein
LDQERQTASVLTGSKAASCKSLKNGHFRGNSYLSGIEPLAWLTDLLERLLPWAWQAQQLTAAVNA